MDNAMNIGHDRYFYGNRPAEVSPAGGVTGVLFRDATGVMVFRVQAGADFTDYTIHHDDLRVTIDADELAAFYKIGEDHILDHSPQVLGLRRTDE